MLHQVNTYVANAWIGVTGPLSGKYIYLPLLAEQGPQNFQNSLPCLPLNSRTSSSVAYICPSCVRGNLFSRFPALPPALPPCRAQPPRPEAGQSFPVSQGYESWGDVIQLITFMDAYTYYRAVLARVGTRLHFRGQGIKG